jgi:hypothetical protein
MLVSSRVVKIFRHVTASEISLSCSESATAAPNELVPTLLSLLPITLFYLTLLSLLPITIYLTLLSLLPITLFYLTLLSLLPITLFYPTLLSLLPITIYITLLSPLPITLFYLTLLSFLPITIFYLTLLFLLPITIYLTLLSLLPIILFYLTDRTLLPHTPVPITDHSSTSHSCPYYRSHPSILLNFHFNITLPSIAQVFLQVSKQNPVYISILSSKSTRTVHLSPSLEHSKNIRRRVQSRSSTSCNFLQPPLASKYL